MNDTWIKKVLCVWWYCSSSSIAVDLGIVIVMASEQLTQRKRFRHTSRGTDIITSRFNSLCFWEMSVGWVILYSLVFARRMFQKYLNSPFLPWRDLIQSPLLCWSEEGDPIILFPVDRSPGTPRDSPTESLPCWFRAWWTCWLCRRWCCCWREISVTIVWGTWATCPPTFLHFHHFRESSTTSKISPLIRQSSHPS